MSSLTSRRDEIAPALRSVRDTGAYCSDGTQPVKNTSAGVANSREGRITEVPPHYLPVCRHLSSINSCNARLHLGSRLRRELSASFVT